jgi:hypothetical protein
VLPEGVVIPASPLDLAGRSAAALADSRALRLNLRAPEVLSLTDPVLAGASAPGAQFQAADRPDLRPGAQTRVTTEERAPVTVRGLPKRVRPASPSQDERGPEPGAAAPAARQAPVESPAPEAARSLAASLQSSWHRSRQADDAPNPGSPGDERLPARHDATAPDTALDSED